MAVGFVDEALAVKLETVRLLAVAAYFFLGRCVVEGLQISRLANCPAALGQEKWRVCGERVEQLHWRAFELEKL